MRKRVDEYRAPVMSQLADLDRPTRIAALRSQAASPTLLSVPPHPPCGWEVGCMHICTFGISL